MRLSQRLALKVSELRAKANAAILALNESTDDTKATELTEAMKAATGDLTEVEQRHTAAVEAETAIDRTEGERFGTEPDSEARERNGLVERANLGAIFAAAVENRHTDGAEHEVQAAHGLGSNAVPLAMLRLPVESRAVTTAPAEVGQTQAAIVPPIFADGDAAFLGVRMPTVASGSAAYPVLTNRPTVGGPHDASQEVDESDGAFTAESLDPERLQASFFWRRVDAAKFRGMADALRSALSNGLSEAMDAQVIAAIVADVGRTDAGAVAETFATYRSKLVYGRLDGRFASSESGIRLLAGAPTVAHMAGQYRGNSGGRFGARLYPAGIRWGEGVGSDCRRRREPSRRDRSPWLPHGRGSAHVGGRFADSGRSDQGEVWRDRRYRRDACQLQGDPDGWLRPDANPPHGIGPGS